ncbi:MAG: hypothetical protein LBQ44_07540 [Treponema sp.]|jgi:hypothetical protein|nr:hypothetical protein [Treponema sp.]
MDTLAITFKMDGPDGRIITPLSIQQAEDYCRGDFAISNGGGKTLMSFRIPASNIPVDFSAEDTLL